MLRNSRNVSLRPYTGADWRQERFLIDSNRLWFRSLKQMLSTGNLLILEGVFGGKSVETLNIRALAQTLLCKEQETTLELLQEVFYFQSHNGAWFKWCFLTLFLQLLWLYYISGKAALWEPSESSVQKLVLLFTIHQLGIFSSGTLVPSLPSALISEIE